MIYKNQESSLYISLWSSITDLANELLKCFSVVEASQALLILSLVPVCSQLFGNENSQKFISIILHFRNNLIDLYIYQITKKSSFLTDLCGPIQSSSHSRCLSSGIPVLKKLWLCMSFHLVQSSSSVSFPNISSASISGLRKCGNIHPALVHSEQHGLLVLSLTDSEVSITLEIPWPAASDWGRIGNIWPILLLCCDNQRLSWYSVCPCVYFSPQSTSTVCFHTIQSVRFKAIVRKYVSVNWKC